MLWWSIAPLCSRICNINHMPHYSKLKQRNKLQTQNITILPWQEYICIRLINNAFSTAYIILHQMVGWLRIRKGNRCVRTYSWPIFWYYRSICIERLGKTRTKFCYNGWSVVWDSNSNMVKYSVPCYEDIWGSRQLHTFLTLALDGGKQLASCPSHLTSRGTAPINHWIGGWVVPRASLDKVVKGKNSCPCWESNPGGPA
jgi:hypothetical protein